MRILLNRTPAVLLAAALVAISVASLATAEDQPSTAAAPAAVAPVAPAAIEIQFGGAMNADGKTLHLRGRDARQQLLVTATLPDGSLRDLTHGVTYQSAPAGVVDVAHGYVTPLADGKTTITATHAAGGKTASLPVIVENSQQDTPVNFGNQV